jgi:hypothetical protein
VSCQKKGAEQNTSVDSGGKSRDARRVAQIVHLGKPFTLVPVMIGAGPYACEACLEGNYIHNYRISAGQNAGDAWLCCVPIDALLGSAFNGCGASATGGYYGNAADTRVQTCLLLDSVSTTVRYIHACIPAPLSAPHVAPR